MSSVHHQQRKYRGEDELACQTSDIDISHTIVLLHSRIDTIKQDRMIRGRLRSLLEHVETFDNNLKCENFIQNIQNEKLFLIISMEFAQSIISKLHHLPQLCRIYICKEDKADHSWADNYIKISAVFDDLNDLLVHVMINTWTQYKYSTDQFDSKESTAVFGNKWDYDDLPVSSRFRHLLKALCSTEYAPNCQQRFIDQYRSVCQGNHCEERDLDQFKREYNKSDAITWYTKQCFVYRCLNKALRQENIKYILLLHFFIYDLFHQIRSISLSDHRNTETIVYRGQLMTEDELNYLDYSEEQRYIYNNAFFSTTYDRNVALAFAGAGVAKENNYQSVVFQIKIKQTDDKEDMGIFADVKNYSFMKDEDEILISMGNAFIIDGIKYDEQGGIWIIDLTLDHYGIRETDWCDPDDDSTEDDDEDKTIRKCRITYPSRSDATYIQIGYLLQSTSRMEKDYEKLSTYYLLLRQLISGAFSVGAYHVGVGLLALQQKYYQLSMKHQRKALKFYSKTLLSNQSDHYTHCILLIIRNCIGSIYFAQNDLTKAIDYYTKLLENKSNFSCFYAWTMRQILDRFLYFARFWKELGQFELIIRLFDSLEKIEETNSSLHAYFEIWLEKHYIADDKLIGTNFLDLVISIGCNENDLIKMNEELKLQSMQKNETFIEKIVKSEKLDYNHTMYGRIGMLYTRLQRMDLALSWFERAIDECPKVEEFDCFNDPNKCTYLIYLSRFYRENNEFDRSWNYLEQAYKIQCQIPVDKEGMQRLKNNYYLEAIDISKRKMNFPEAIQYCQKALDNDPECVKTFEQLGDVYQQLRNYTKAKECYLKAIELKPRYNESGTDSLYRTAKKVKNYWNKIQYLNEKQQAANYILPEH